MSDEELTARIAAARARVAAVRARAAAVGFTLSCEPGVGGLLAVLAAAVPPGGRILEMGTGIGVGTSSIVEGVGGRDDVEVVSVEIDPVVAAHARAGAWPPWGPPPSRRPSSICSTGSAPST